MAIKDIPDLAAAAALAGTNLVPITQGSDVPVKATLSTTATFVLEQPITGYLTFSTSARGLKADTGSDSLTNLDLEITGVATANGNVRVFRITNTTGTAAFIVYAGDGTATEEMNVSGGGGSKFGNPTGGLQGAGTINAQAVYDDGVLLTPYVLEQARDGAVDLVALDAKVPDRTDDDGNVVEERTHEPARKFLARIGTEYDPLDLDKYAQHWKDKTHLSSMVNPASAADGKVMSMGEWVQRLIETVEIQAVHIDKLNQMNKTLAQRVEALETLLP